MGNTNENYTIVENYELPSKGLIYETKIDPYVELRSMTTKEEMKRLAPSNTPFRTLSNVIETCMITKPAIPVYDMCLGDYEFLLHKLRVVTHGPDYRLVIQCPHCQSIHEEIVNLDDLKIISYDDDAVKELMSLTLPKTQRKITLHYQTPRIVDNTNLKIAEFKKKNKAAELDPEILVTLQHIIDTVDGEKLSYSKLEDFISSLPLADTNYIIAKKDALNRLVGLDNIVELTCKNCGGEVFTFFRYGPEFFRPTVDGDR